jgi:hypothetical protein
MICALGKAARLCLLPPASKSAEIPHRRPDTGCGDLRLDQMRGVIDCQPSVHFAARAVEIYLNIPFRTFLLQIEELGHDQIR